MMGSVSELSANEREHLIPEEIRNGQRLACLAVIEGDFTLFIDYWQTDAKAKTNLLRYRPGKISRAESATGIFLFLVRKRNCLPDL